MKTIRTLLGLALLSSFANAAAPAVGSVSAGQQFARNSGAGFNSTGFDDYEGRILIVMMMTPWCPICQSHARSVGSGIVSYFDNPSRGSLRGMNDNGVPIQSILLSTEEAASWDSVNESFSNTNGFKQWGLDADTQRRDPREMLGYYRGGFINSTNLYDWGNDRRRVVVLNLVRRSASHSFREIVINQNSYTSGDNTAARAAINAILPQAEVIPPVMEVEQGSAKLQNGTSTVSFDNVNVGDASTLTFTVLNSGGSDLTGIAATLTGSEVADYQVGAPAETTVGPDAATTFTVTFRPLAGGVRQAVLNVTSSAAGVAPFTVNLTGTSGMPGPEIGIQQPRGTRLVDGNTSRSFGTARIERKGRSLTFRIFNTGDADLTGISIAKSGNNPNDFIITAPGRTTLAPGMYTDFVVEFRPRGTGTRKASLKLRSNDADESPFNIRVAGFGAR